VAGLDGHGKSRFTGTVQQFMIGQFYMLYEFLSFNCENFTSN